MADDDYYYAAPYDDEDLLKNGGYAPAVAAPPDTSDLGVSSLAAPPSAYLGAPAVSAPPAAGSFDDLEAHAAAPRLAPMPPAPPARGSLEDLESRAASPSWASTAAPAAPAPQRPQWKDYAPAQPHGFKGFMEGVGAMISPQFGQYLENRRMNPAIERYKNATAEYEAPAVEAAREAQTEDAQARTELARAQTKNAIAPQPEWESVTGIRGPGGQPIEREKHSGQYRYAQLPGGATPLKTPSDTQVQRKEAVDAVTAILDKAGLPTDPKNLAKSLDTAKERKLITPDQHAAVASYMTTDATPSTNLTVHVAGNEEAQNAALDKMFEGKEVIAHMPDGRRVQMAYGDAKSQNIPRDRLVALTEKEAQENRDKGASTGATFQSLDTYRKDFKASTGKLSALDIAALNSITQHAHDGSTAGLLAGFLDDIPVAGPVTEMVNKMVSGGLLGGSYQKLSPEGKKLVSDYFTAVIANFANMKNIMGSVGRNPMQLQAEINTIPLPNLDWESASDAFDNKRDDLKRRAGSQPEIYAPKK